MAKEVKAIVKLALDAGKANPGPPVGTALGPLGVNSNEFCTKYNEITKDQMGSVVPVEITVFDDRTFSLVLKTPPAAFLLKKAAGLKSGSANGCKEVVGTISEAQLQEIAEIKMPDLNANDIEAAKNIVAGTAKNMGISIEGR